MLRDELIASAEKLERERNNDPTSKDYWRAMHSADALRAAAAAVDFRQAFEPESYGY